MIHEVSPRLRFSNPYPSLPFVVKCHDKHIAESIYELQGLLESFGSLAPSGEELAIRLLRSREIMKLSVLYKSVYVVFRVNIDRQAARYIAFDF